MTAKIFKKNKLVQPQGFTVVEALIAVAVTSIGLVAILGVTVYALSISRVSPDEVIAANLAQEGIEVIRNIRDTNLLQGVNFNQGISAVVPIRWAKIDFNTVGGFALLLPVAVNGGPLGCAQNLGDLCRLFIDSNGFYSHDNAGQPTKFYRLIRLQSLPTDIIKVRSQVVWQDRQGNWRQTIIQNDLRQYDLDKVASDVKRFEWQDTGMEVVCTQGLKLEEDSSTNCNVLGVGQGGYYHQNWKCGRCCLQPACDNYNDLIGEFIYLAPFDESGRFLESNPNLPAFFGDPRYVCDIFRDGQWKCQLYEKIEL